MFKRLFFSFARQPKKVTSNPKIHPADDFQKQMARDKNMAKLVDYLDPKTSKLLDKYIDSLNSESFSGMMTEFKKDLQSENSKFKILSDQAFKNKVIVDLLEGDTEFVKKLKARAKVLQEEFEFFKRKK